jgi:phospholipid/cholesterol/gamma-HCH transport system ATP-binding protein
MGGRPDKPGQPGPAAGALRDAPVLEVESLVREFDGRRVLDGVSFRVYPGETFVIMGASGCGKSTLLRHLIGAERPTSGTVKLFGRDLNAVGGFERIALRKRFGMLFQSGALLQSLSVAENVALPLVEHTKLPASVIDLTVKMKLEQVGLTGHGDKRPSEISGGMKKRVALARALSLDPSLLFSDEPTAGLDPVMTAVIDKLTIDLTAKIGATVVVVTHDMASAFRIGSRMIMLGTGDRQGQVVAAGTPDEIRADPDPMLQQFIQGLPDGPIPYKLSAEAYGESLLGGR